jgi:hypothetical protein
MTRLLLDHAQDWHRPETRQTRHEPWVILLGRITLLAFDNASIVLTRLPSAMDTPISPAVSRSKPFSIRN